jgi:hypothetical protein
MENNPQENLILPAKVDGCEILRNRGWRKGKAGKQTVNRSGPAGAPSGAIMLAIRAATRL